MHRMQLNMIGKYPPDTFWKGEGSDAFVNRGCVLLLGEVLFRPW